MRERLEQFMKSEGLSSSRFADILEVQPSSISHILGGRNKPSYDFIEKLLDRFPRLNPDWLILGKGEMLRTSVNTMQQDLFNRPKEFEQNELKRADATIHNNSEVKADEAISSINSKINSKSENNDAVVSKIIFVYDDKTYMILNPNK